MNRFKTHQTNKTSTDRSFCRRENLKERTCPKGKWVETWKEDAYPRPVEKSNSHTAGKERTSIGTSPKIIFWGFWNVVVQGPDQHRNKHIGRYGYASQEGSHDRHMSVERTVWNINEGFRQNGHGKKKGIETNH